MKSLENKIALVTGASRGLGTGIAIELAAQGAEVIVNYNGSENRASEVVKEIQDAGGKAVKMQADVSDQASTDRLFKEIMRLYGRLDILINNAGTSQAKDIFDINNDDWNRIINTNLTSGYYCSKKAMEIFRNQNSGRIIFISSVVGLQGALYGHVHYAATKSGQLGVMRTLARTAAPYNVTVNAIAPGIIETELLLEIHGEEGVKKIADTIPLGLGKVKDVGNAVAFLCSDESGYLTGITLDVNGGMYMH
ncbi:SDR family NAD(P)-dependent oxidoreductase [Arcticibacter tournemirensis]